MFQVIVQVFIWIVLWRIGREEKQPDSILVFLYPILYKFPVVDLEVVQNDVDFTRNILEQPLQKLDQLLLIHAFLTEHEVQFPLIADGADHVDMHLPGFRLQHWGVAFRRITSGIVGHILYSGLIAPENLCIFLLRLGVDGWINRYRTISYQPKNMRIASQMAEK